MNRKQFITLLVLVVLLGGGGLVVYHNQQKAQSSGNATIGRKLFTDLPVNDITHLTIRRGTNEVNLVRQDDLWRVRERQDYPANFSEISAFLLKVRDLKAAQTEQVGASQLPRLQLATSGQGTNAPVVIEFKGQNDKAIATLLLGKMHLNSRGAASMPGGEGEAGWPDGRYVKTGADSENVAVISDPLENIEPKPESWLSKDFIRVEKPRAIQVEFPVATNSWTVTRETESGEWKLAGTKPGEELDPGKSSSLSNPLGSPSFNDVLPGEKLSGTNQPVAVTIDTFDNFHYVIKAGEKTNDTYPMTVAVTAQIAKERTAGKDEKPEEKVRLDKEFKDKQQALEDRLKREQGYQKWTYLVSSWSLEPLLKERSQLLTEKKDKEEPGKDGNSVTQGNTKSDEPKIEDPPLPAITTKP